MNADETAWERVSRVLDENWEFPVTGHRRLSGGRNAISWRVSGPAGVAVAKLVEPGDSSLGQFEASLRVAAALDRPDLPTAPPLPSRDGRVVVPAGAGRLALLPWLSGRPLTGTADADLDRMGAVLAALHRRMAGLGVPTGIPTWPWTWLSLEAHALTPLEPADSSLVDRAASAAAGIYQIGIVHGDPRPDHFLASGPATGVIDWASVMEGPQLYDLAVLTLGAEQAGARRRQISRLIACYGAAASETDLRPGAVTTGGLAAMRALRLAAEVVYFTSRLRQPTVPADTDDDLAGLNRARVALRVALPSGPA